VAGRTDVFWVATQLVLFAAIAAFVFLAPGTAPTPGLLVGIAAILAGAALAVAAIRRIGPRVSPFPTPLEGVALTTTGIYGLVRHPIYGGVILMAAGGSIVSWSFPAMALTASLVPFFMAKSAHEERLLLARFPDYAQYRLSTPKRLLPWVL
jgi:protein-S-isoprenylcysteine O-methyltransferase Ste14